MNVPFFLVNWRGYTAEFLGTFVVVFISCGAVLVNTLYGDIGNIGVALATGLAYTAAMYATFFISGGHLNPAITLSLWLARKISSVTFIFYLMSQIAAGFAAACLLLYIFGDRGVKFYLGGPMIGVEVSQQIAVVVEAVLVAILVFVFFATALDKRGQIGFAPMAVGLLVVGATIFASQLTGAALNPAGVIGPLVISRSSSDLVVFVLGASLSSIFGIIYDFLFLKSRKK